jgi:hypothetical protein
LAIAIIFSQGRSLILQGIFEGLRSRADGIATIEKVPNLEYPVNGVSLDPVPRHSAPGVSLRLHAVTPAEDGKRRGSHLPALKKSGKNWSFFGNCC